MGNSTIRKYFTEPDSTPDTFSEPTFDPMIGFPNGRKPRVMKASFDEMFANRVPLKFRDYCAHLYLELERCRKKVFPMIYKCEHQKHELEQCEYHDYILRMKEYERECRLRKLANKERENAAAA